jgi:hypothetical protein
LGTHHVDATIWPGTAIEINRRTASDGAISDGAKTDGTGAEGMRNQKRWVGGASTLVSSYLFTGTGELYGSAVRTISSDHRWNRERGSKALYDSRIRSREHR